MLLSQREIIELAIEYTRKQSKGLTTDLLCVSCLLGMPGFHELTSKLIRLPAFLQTKTTKQNLDFF